MANEAQKEPTMEEILASIKRIIAEDDGPRSGAVTAKSDKPLSPGDILGEGEIDDGSDVSALDEIVEDAAEDELDAVLEDAFDDLDFTDEDLTLPGENELETEEGAAADVFEEIVSDGEGDDFDLDDLGLELTDELLDETEESLSGDDQPGPFENDPADDDEAEALGTLKSAEDVFEDDETLPEVPVRMEPAQAARSVETMAKPAVKQETHLTDESSATAAANAMSKLLGRMDLGGENTVEGLIRQMLKPMLKEWLDANLPRIVEAKVEEEVQRISRLAR